MDCGRGEIGERTCIDYGVTHSRYLRGCERLRARNPDAIFFVNTMKKECGVRDLKDSLCKRTVTQSLSYFCGNRLTHCCYVLKY